MFIGHFGLGFGTKKLAPTISLGTLFIAFQFLDLVWPTLLLLGIEDVVIHPELGGTRTLEFIYYPYTHSLLMVILWSVLFGSVYWFFKKNTRNAIILGIGVLSHWVLDLIVHFHDLPLIPGQSVFVGFGLWGSVVATNIIEIALLTTGIVLYLRSTTPLNKKGAILPWVLVVLLALVQISNLVGPPPETVTALAWSAQFQWLFVVIAYWADGNRSQK
ncbi:MAG TPA: metal-dependent hydrolase [Cyclobacteriaceae bacterium]